VNTDEHLMVCAIEESLEIGQAACKALRFGVNDGHPGTNRTNINDFIMEVNDLMGVLELIEENGVKLPNLFDRKAILAKKEKVIKFMGVARDLGTLKNNIKSLSEVIYNHQPKVKGDFLFKSDKLDSKWELLTIDGGENDGALSVTIFSRSVPITELKGQWANLPA